jgi:hypothetical protein
MRMPIPVIGPSIAYLPLTKSQFSCVNSDFEPSGNFRAQWNKNTNSYYAVGRNGILHRELISAPEGMMVDHINRSTLDNRVQNLRIATNCQNQHNTKKRIDNSSGIRGVRLENGRWRAQIKCNGKNMHLGIFPTAEQAKYAYDKKAIELSDSFYIG